MKATWPGAVARRMGLGGEITFTPTRVGLTLHVPCDKGKHVVDVVVDPGVHPDHVVKRMLQKGWTFGAKLACPEHRRCTRKPSNQNEATPVATTAPSPDARAARREAHEHIALYFDIATGLYTDGYSDARIAKETGVAEEWVKHRREEEFGQLADPKPAEFQAIQNELKRVATEAQSAFGAFQRSLNEITQKVEAICKARGWAK